MFDKEIRGEIKSARVKVTEDGSFVFRTVRLALEREFDSDIAATIGGSAGDALEHLSDGGMSKVVLLLDAVSARGVLSGKSKVSLDKVSGVKATASIGKAKEDEDAPLKVKVEFEFPFSAEAWAMLGAEAGTTIGITLTRNQLDLPGTSKQAAAVAPAAPETKPNGKKTRTPKAKLGTKHAEDPADVAGDIVDPQDAATPEEAEDVRAQRLREQRAQDEEAWNTPGATVQ